MYFKDIIGQEKAISHLVSSVQDGRIANTQMFLGAPGSGTLMIALAYSRFVLCSNKSDRDSCGECSSCKMLDKLAHPDLHFSFPIILSAKAKLTDPYLEEFRGAVMNEPYMVAQDWYAHLGQENKQGVIGVDESANILKKLQLRSFSGGYKIMLIWMPETINLQAANKLLKAFEEPPEKTIYILVANSIEKLLPTVISRTQIFKIPPLKVHEVAEGLSKFMDLEEDERMAIAMRSSGDMNVALKDARAQNGVLLEQFRDWMRLCFKKDVLGSIGFVDSIARAGRENQKALLRYALHMSRQCVVHEHQLNDLLRSSGPEYEFIQKFSPFLNSEKAVEIQIKLDKASSHLERNANAKILFMDLTFTLFKLIGK